MRDLPMPGSPEISTTRPSPALARSQRRNSRSISSSRPTSGVSADRATPRTGSDDARTQHLPSRHRLGDALDLDGAEIAVVEQIADQPPRARGDHDSVRLGQRLQPGGEVRRLADDRLLLRRALADQIADDHEPGGDADPRLELGGFDVEAADSVDRRPARRGPPARRRPHALADSRNRRDAVAHIFGDKAVEPGDHLGDGAVIGADDLAQILRIEPRRQRRRADEVAEHHRQLPAFGLGAELGYRGAPSSRSNGRLGAERDDGGEQLAAVADRGHAKADQVVGRQLPQYLGVDIVIKERRARSARGPSFAATPLRPCDDPRPRGRHSSSERIFLCPQAYQRWR